MPPRAATSRGVVLGEVSMLIQKQMAEIYSPLEKAEAREQDSERL